jgi:hypothetical protein
MITLGQPSMALNAKDVPGPHYKMWNTWEIPAGESPSHILGWASAVAKGAPGGKLNALVFNCHGSPAHLHMGTGIGWPEVALFSMPGGLVHEIYSSLVRS